jgi:ferric-dicitrate binding protein FerR (iron transport regulator)
MDAALTQREFDTWREGDEAFKQEMRQLMMLHADLHRKVEGRISTLEANHKKQTTQAVNRTTWVSAIVSAIVGGLFGWVAK